MQNLLEFNWVANRLSEDGKVYGWGGYDKDNKLRMAVNEIYKPTGGVSLGYCWFIYNTDKDGLLAYGDTQLDIIQTFAELSEVYADVTQGL